MKAKYSHQQLILKLETSLQFQTPVPVDKLFHFMVREVQI